MLEEAGARLAKNAEMLHGVVASAKQWKVAAAAQKNMAQEVMAAEQAAAGERKKAERAKQEVA